MNFSCTHCGLICDWYTRQPSGAQEYKTIGSMYCNHETCIAAEALATDSSVDEVRLRHQAEGAEFDSYQMPPEMVPALAKDTPATMDVDATDDTPATDVDADDTDRIPIPVSDMSDADELSPGLREALTCLAEECSEVIQAVTKILRFGVKVNPYTGEHNLATLERELADVVMITGVLHGAEIIDTERIEVQAIAKLTRCVERSGDGRFKHLFTDLLVVDDPDAS